MPKHRIFMKIYLWFWLASFVIFFSQVTLDKVMQSGPRVNEMRHADRYVLSLVGQAAVDILEREDISSLERYISTMEQSALIIFFLFDSTGNEVTGKKRPADIDSLAALAEKSGKLELVLSGRDNLAAQSLESRSGRRYIAAAVFTQPPGNDLQGPPPFSLLRLVVVLIVSGGICYWLAQYIAAPIVKLSNAVRQFAGGDLSVRVSSSIGDRKDEISTLASAFDRMAVRIESLLTSQRNLLRDVSHELRSPLARLNVALELCRKRCSPEVGKSLDRITRESDKLNELIGQILTFNLFESGMSSMEKSKVDLTKLIMEIADNADFEAKSMNRAVKVVTSDACTILGNEELLRRAIENVVRNAVLYTGENSAVEISLKKIIIENVPYVSIAVRDHGPGVSEDEIMHLFKPFYRIDNNHVGQPDGAGIGLAITEAAVRFHGGSVKASNAPDGGLLVEITIPPI